MALKVDVKWQKELLKDVEIDTEQPPLVFKSQLFTLTGMASAEERVVLPLRWHERLSMPLPASPPAPMSANATAEANFRCRRRAGPAEDHGERRHAEGRCRLGEAGHQARPEAHDDGLRRCAISAVARHPDSDNMDSGPRLQAPMLTDAAPLHQQPPSLLDAMPPGSWSTLSRRMQQAGSQQAFGNSSPDAPCRALGDSADTCPQTWCRCSPQPRLNSWRTCQRTSRTRAAWRATARGWRTWATPAT